MTGSRRDLTLRTCKKRRCFSKSSRKTTRGKVPLTGWGDLPLRFHEAGAGQPWHPGNDTLVINPGGEPQTERSRTNFHVTPRSDPPHLLVPPGLSRSTTGTPVSFRSWDP